MEKGIYLTKAGLKEELDRYRNLADMRTLLLELMAANPTSEVRTVLQNMLILIETFMNQFDLDDLLERYLEFMNDCG